MINMDKLLAYCDGDPELAMSFLEMFRSEAEAALEEMPRLRDSGQLERLSNTAHKLKSHCRYIGAERAADLAQSVELLAESKSEDKLDAELSAFYPAIQAVLNSF